MSGSPSAFIAFFWLWCLMLRPAFGEAPWPSVAETRFVRDVLPILEQRCIVCHGKDEGDIHGGLDLRRSEPAMRGGDGGESLIIPGRPTESPLLLSVLRESDDWTPMPPKENDRLSANEVQSLREWIRLGAVWPTEAQIAAILAEPKRNVPAESGMQTVSTTQALDAAWQSRSYAEADLWAYRPLHDLQPPKSSEHPIDAFINARLEATGLQAAPHADARSLIRRASIDLTGLLPSSETAGEFVLDPSDRNWGRYIEQLLSSSEYGEHMARHWLDVVRYADTAGFSNDFDRPHAWRYRDYVVRSFQSDKPYNRFVREQIAGDELTDANNETIIATGFLRMGPWEHSGMAVEAETRQQWLDDVVNTVGNTFLGLEMSCFKCHDHKFDPLPTRDYYSMQAVFATTQPADMKVRLFETPLAEDFESQSRAAKALVERFNDQKSRAKIGGFGRGTTMNRLQRWSKQYEPLAMGVYNGPTRTFNSKSLTNLPPSTDKRVGQLMTVSILGGGSLAAPMQPVEPAALSAIESLVGWTANPFPRTAANRRLALADWIVDRNNPLHARVIVNRVWGWHFGAQPLVATPNNFGVKGSKPSYPELLDWLARWFIDHDYSFKKLHRLIMTSDAYRRSISIPAGTDTATATKLLASFPVRRLSAEELRDVMLQCSGELVRANGGIPARPQMNWDAAMAAVNVQGGIDIPYRPDLTPSERNRRSIYTYRMRSRRDPFFEVFNQPASERSCGLRDESIVVPQACAMMNGDFIADRSIALADRLLKHFAAMPICIDAAYDAIYGRPSTQGERSKCLDFVALQIEHHAQHEPPRLDITKKITALSPYNPDYARRYVADLQYADVPPRTRALADLCLTLLNTSEFLYLP